MMHQTTHILLIAFAVTTILAIVLNLGPPTFAWLRRVNARRNLLNEIDARRKQLKQLRGLADKGFIRFQ